MASNRICSLILIDVKEICEDWRSLLREQRKKAEYTKQSKEIKQKIKNLVFESVWSAYHASIMRLHALLSCLSGAKRLSNCDMR